MVNYVALAAICLAAAGAGWNGPATAATPAGVPAAQTSTDDGIVTAAEQTDTKKKKKKTNTEQRGS